MENSNASAQAAGAQSGVRERVRHASVHAERLAEPVGLARWQNVYFLPVGDVLGKHHFLKQMERERLRTDRSKAPLSVVLFRMETTPKPGEFGGVEGLLRALDHSKRETDILGYLREDLVALLLPDTGEPGMQGFLRKIKSRIERFRVSMVSGTYPNQVFDQLLREPSTLPTLSPFYIATSKHRKEPGYLLKRTLDIVGAVAGLLLLSPVMLITAIAVAMDSHGPVFFKQARLGRGGVPFRFYKFRSMFVNADDRIHREFVTKLIQGKLEEVNQGDADNPYYKIKSDPRVTRVGMFIRDKSIDELPQLFNVLRGDMSLVGPRPPLPYEVESYESWHLMRILEVKPGITGLWQVGGHSTTTFDDMVRLDLRYIRNCSLILDLKILFKTVKMLLRWG
jgi:lipopolysaccharide/colanic/teichoic acid biosynthesis glycosyltransferase